MNLGSASKGQLEFYEVPSSEETSFKKNLWFVFQLLYVVGCRGVVQLEGLEPVFSPVGPTKAKAHGTFLFMDGFPEV